MNNLNAAELEALAMFKRCGEFNADELAHALGWHILNVRPICTNLKNKGYIEVTGKKRPSILGNPSDVLRAV